MDAAAVTAELLARSGLTKSELSARSGVSRSLLDAYLKGQRQPSLAQIDRLAAAADLQVDLVWSPRRRSVQQVSERFVLVMELAEALPHDNFPPLRFPSMLLSQST